MEPLYCHRETLDRCRKGKRGSGGDPSDSLALPSPFHLPRAFPLSLTLLLSIAIAFLHFLLCGFLFVTLVVPLPFYTRLNGSRSLFLLYLSLSLSLCLPFSLSSSLSHFSLPLILLLSFLYFLAHFIRTVATRAALLAVARVLVGPSCVHVSFPFSRASLSFELAPLSAAP